MTKILSTLILAAFAFSAQAASHAGGAPMKASEPKAEAKHDKKHDAKHDKKDEKKADAPAAAASKK